MLAPYVAPLISVALFGPFWSAAVLSAVHQLISPLGGATAVNSERSSRHSRFTSRMRLDRVCRVRDRDAVEKRFRIERLLGLGVGPWPGPRRGRWAARKTMRRKGTETAKKLEK